MRDDLPPFARFVFGIASFAMAMTGFVMWMLGWALAFSTGLLLAIGLIPADDRDLLEGGIILVVGLVLETIGSAMYFFSRTLIEHQPQNVPTELLPRWWLARFMVPFCFQLAIVSFAGVILCLFRLDLIGLLWSIGLLAGDRGFRHFRMKTIQLSPPYPPRTAPPKWETRG